MFILNWSRIESKPQNHGDLCILPVEIQQSQTLARKQARTSQSTDPGIISPENQLLVTSTTYQPSTSCPSGSDPPILTLRQQRPTPVASTNTPTSSSKSTTPLQELRAVARHIERNPRYQRSQPHQQATQSILREKTRLGYKA